MFTTFICISYLTLSAAQNMGVGTASPTEKLEVAGMIYSNEGGIKFPDETVQTTAAYNVPQETYPVVRGGGFGKFGNADLDGNIDTLGMTKLSYIYDLKFSIDRTPNNVIFSELEILKQSDKGSPGFFKFLMNTTLIPTMEFLLTKPNSSGNLEIYYKIKLTNVFVSALEPALYPTVDGWYSNVDRILLSFHTITLTDVPSGKCYCWNQVTNAVCGCP